MLASMNRSTWDETPLLDFAAAHPYWRETSASVRSALLDAVTPEQKHKALARVSAWAAGDPAKERLLQMALRDVVAAAPQVWKGFEGDDYDRLLVASEAVGAEPALATRTWAFDRISVVVVTTTTLAIPPPPQTDLPLVLQSSQIKTRLQAITKKFETAVTAVAAAETPTSKEALARLVVDESQRATPLDTEFLLNLLQRLVLRTTLLPPKSIIARSLVADASQKPVDAKTALTGFAERLVEVDAFSPTAFLAGDLYPTVSPFSAV